MIKTLQLAILGAVIGAANQAYAIQDMTSVLPDAKAGECYAKVVIPAKYRTESSTVVVKEASEQIKIIPAKYEWSEQRLLVSEGQSELKVIPATFATETETYEVSPAGERWVMGSRNSGVVASAGLLESARAGGANLNGATPGQCFVEHFKPPQYKTVAERVLVSEPSEQITLNAAKYEWVEQRVMIEPASRKLIEVPASFETVQEKIKVEDAKTVWKKGHGPIQKIDEASGEIMCLVEVPAVYKTLSKRVMKTPASSRVMEEPARYETIRVRKLVSDASENRVSVPGKYKDISKTVKTADASHSWHGALEKGNHLGKRTGSVVCLEATPAKMASVTRKVVKQPASVERVEIPAKYETKRVSRLVSEAREVRSVIPAKTNDIAKRIKVSDARMEWRPILCETNTSGGLVQDVQRALKSAGFTPGPIDGVLGTQTMAAVERFQRARGMATGGLTFDTLNKLGVKTGS